MLLTEDHDVVGYLFTEARPRHEVVFFWYLAIDESRRGHRLGTLMVSEALDFVRERWPTCRAVFLETTHPEHPDDKRSDDMRRVDFYRKLGFFWVKGLSYWIPPATEDVAHTPAKEPFDLLSYDPMFYNLRERCKPLPTAFVRKAALEMARDNFLERPTDPRWKALKESVVREILAPEDCGE
jgi:GNAT superfamily N-acetyltransferase